MISTTESLPSGFSATVIRRLPQKQELGIIVDLEKMQVSGLTTSILPIATVTETSIYISNLERGEAGDKGTTYTSFAGGTINRINGELILTHTLRRNGKETGRAYYRFTCKPSQRLF
jgi:hypothetical protein